MRATITTLEPIVRWLDDHAVPLPGKTTADRIAARAALAGATWRALDARALKIADVYGRSRKAALVAARADIAAELRDRGWSLPEIGRALDRDHSTILHHLEKRTRT